MPAVWFYSKARNRTDLWNNHNHRRGLRELSQNHQWKGNWAPENNLQWGGRKRGEDGLWNKASKEHHCQSCTCLPLVILQAHQFRNERICEQVQSHQLTLQLQATAPSKGDLRWWSRGRKERFPWHFKEILWQQLSGKNIRVGVIPILTVGVGCPLWLFLVTLVSTAKATILSA